MSGIAPDRPVDPGWAGAGNVEDGCGCGLCRV